MKVSDEAMLSELRRIMEEATPDEAEAEGATVAELCRSLGCGEKRVLKLVQSGIQSGRIVAGKRRTRAIDGLMRWQPVYRVVDVEVRTK